MEENREFSISYSDLIQKSDHFINIATRDSVVLIGYGMAETLPEETQTLRDQFADMPTDEEMLAPVEEATAAKNAARGEVEIAMKDIYKRAELCFGKNSPTMKRFKIGTIGDLTDSELYRTGGRMVRAATSLLDKLTTNGLTAEMLTEAKAKNSTFDGLIDDREDLESIRIAATAVRVETANNLYALIAKISGYGKAAFEGKDDIKADEYNLGE